MKLPDTDAQVVVLHNPRCSKSRATVALLKERGIAFEERRYLEEPLSRAELADLTERLGRPPSEWVRRKESEFAAAGLDAGSPDDAILGAIVEHPILIERPIVIRGKRARLGRPPEEVLTLFVTPRGLC